MPWAPSIRRAAAWLLAGAGASGCQYVLGEIADQCTRDEDCPASIEGLACVDGLCVEVEVATTTTGEASSGTTDAECSPDGECLPAAPMGWSGPVLAVFSQSDPGPCPDVAPASLRIGHAGLQAPDPVCGCACPPINADMDCGVTIFGGQECAKTLPWVLPEDTCKGIPLYVLLPMSEAVFPAGFDACTPQPTVEAPPVSWDDHVRLCETAQVECDAGVCVPGPTASDGAPRCIWREGDSVCPDPSYPLRYVFHEDVIDERGCTPCTCGEQAACRIEIFPDGPCEEDVVWETPLTEALCLPITDIVPTQLATIGAIASRIPRGPGVCEPSLPVPTGEAQPSGTFTLCCRS